MEFNEYLLKDIATIIMGQSPKSEYYSDFNGTPFLQGNRTFNNLYPTIDTYTTKITKTAEKNDILFSVRAPVGEINIAPFELCIGRGLSAIRSKNKDNKFLHYLLIYKLKDIHSKSTGIIFKSINNSTLENLEIKIPNEKFQKFIGTLLRNIDNKVELNHKIIANLEELSQTLFKRWFVDFEFPDEDGNPYKSSGGEMIDSELGDIPNRWKIGTLSDIAEIVMGQSPKSNTYNNEQVGLPLLNGASDFKNKNIQPAKYTSMPKKIGHNLDYVFGVRATIGLVTELDNDYAIGRGAGICKSNKETREFIYEVLNRAFKYFERIGSGSVYINISSKDLKQFKLIIPSKQALMEYHYHLEPIFSEIRNLKKQVKLLINMRDSLLPKLMSGEIKIPDDIEVNTDELSI